MKQKVDPKIFIGAIALVAIIVGVVLYKSLQPPAPVVAQPSSNTMYNSGTAQYRQAMKESMDRSKPQGGGGSSQYRQGYMNMSNGHGSGH